MSQEITGSCHCGAVQITVLEKPSQLLECNCSLCTKSGWIVAFYHPDQVEISAEDLLTPYVQGDKSIAVQHCKNCGCQTHWTPLTAPPERMGVNIRLFNRSLWADMETTKVDGASW